MHTLGIVLAGGASRRMGLADRGGKAAVMLEGRTLLGHVCNAVRPAVDRLVVVAAADQPVASLAEIDTVIRDSRPGAGPLAGMADALRTAGADIDRAFVASCDVPLLRTALVRRLLDEVAMPGVAWAVPFVDGHPQVLVSALRPILRGEIEAHLAAGRRDPRGLLDRLATQADGDGTRVRLVPAADLLDADPELVSFTDIDTPADLARIAGQFLYSAPWRCDIPERRGDGDRADAG
jgi:molybdopterin-guanine dinucleotide biosynthesis protein A